MKSEKHEAWLRGFNVAIQIVMNNLKLAEYDFTGCKNSRQICSLIEKSLKDELVQYKSCDYKYGTVEKIKKYL